MEPYHKIETLFLRDEDFNLTDQLRNPVYGTIDPWTVTEKIDGTNIRVALAEDDQVRFGGRTDNAQIHSDLYRHLQETFTQDNMRALRLDDEPVPIALYGEGYGAGIQNGGDYREDKGFILFDVKVGEWWLLDEAVTEIAEKLEIPRVPILGQWTLKEIVAQVRDGFKSPHAQAERVAEGIVARPIEPLFDRRGKRIVVKLKQDDFRIKPPRKRQERVNS